MLSLRIIYFSVLILAMSSRDGLSNDSNPEAKTNYGRIPLRVAYFTALDSDPHTDFQPRLTRVMSHIQAFYREGMRKNGFGPRTFELERESNDLLRIWLVRGSKAIADYDRDKADSKTSVRTEVAAELAKHGIDFEKEVVIVFQNLLISENGQLREFGPFIGGGNGVKGSALIYDSSQLDAQFLSSNQPDPLLPGKTLGDFNSRYIGGAAHELGHAFGLAHDAESEQVRSRFGKSLMGRGNHDYGEEFRGKSRGAFLSAASAFPLSLHTLFQQRDKAGEKNIPSKIDFDLNLRPPALRRSMLKINGTATGNTPVAGIVAFNDPSADPSDYDAIGYSCKVNPLGEFSLTLSNLIADRYSFRVRVYSEDGRAEHFEYRYQITPDGKLSGDFSKSGSEN